MPTLPLPALKHAYAVPKQLCCSPAGRGLGFAFRGARIDRHRQNDDHPMAVRLSALLFDADADRIPLLVEGNVADCELHLRSFLRRLEPAAHAAPQGPSGAAFIFFNNSAHFATSARECT